MLQRMAVRKLRRKAGRGAGEPLEPEDWEIAWRMHETGFSRMLSGLFRVLPSSPRCGICAAPFAGPGRIVASPLGFQPSRKNPTICSTCVEFSPPGGMKMETGVLFADLRGFTARSAGSDPVEVSRVLRRFYRCAEDVLFPDAVIDKLIGDEVMAIYMPDLTRRFTRDDVPAVMLDHARGLLREVGYGSAEGPFVDLGVGLDFGEAFVGNIGDRWLWDFTAVGEVVNNAAALQSRARSGEVLMSAGMESALANENEAPRGLALRR